MKILFASNYYFPYISGVSECERMLAEEFNVMGHDVTVSTSNHTKLPASEVINGVKVERSPIICKISKGTISPAFIWKTIREAKQADVVNLHLPMLESSILSLFIKKEKLVVTYHSDISLGKGLFNKFIVKTVYWSNRICLRRAKKIVIASIDYAQHSEFLKPFIGKIMETGSPIKEYRPIAVKKDPSIRKIGFCGRIVMEKGIDVLIKAFEILSKSVSDIRLIIAGDYANVAGGSIYPQIKDYIEKNQIKNVEFCGKIPEEEMPAFYSGLNLFVLPSMNPLEAFGMVQLEAMLCGTPVVSSDLYGVRTIVQKTGMGLISRRGDAENLAGCMQKILDNPEAFKKTREEILEYFGTSAVIKRYAQAFGATETKET